MHYLICSLCIFKPLFSLFESDLEPDQRHLLYPHAYYSYYITGCIVERDGKIVCFHQTERRKVNHRPIRILESVVSLKPV